MQDDESFVSVTPTVISKNNRTGGTNYSYMGGKAQSTENILSQVRVSNSNHQAFFTIKQHISLKPLAIRNIFTFHWTFILELLLTYSEHAFNPVDIYEI
jgi:hypothetical protein